jgi:hypothetical protein
MTLDRIILLLIFLQAVSSGCTSQDLSSTVGVDASDLELVKNSVKHKKYEVIDEEIPLIYYGTIDGVYLGYQVAPHIVAERARLAFYDYMKTGNETQLERALFLTDYIISNGTQKDDGSIMVWEYGFDWPVYNLSKGWIGSLEQGGILKILMLAYQNTGDEKYLEYGDMALRAFTVEKEKGGLKYYRTDDGVSYAWYPEYARDTPPYVLNGFATSLIWIKEYHIGTGNPLALEIFDSGVKSAAHFLPTYDFDGWSYYDAEGHRSSDKYHKIHIYQMDTLHKMTGDPIFKEYLLKWNQSTSS